MNTVVGVFASRAEAEHAAARLPSAGLSKEEIVLLEPEAGKKEHEPVPTSETEQPGMGTAVGSVVGGAVGLAGGFHLGAAVTSAAIPGVGPVIATGLMGAAVLGLAGAGLGAVAGHALESAMTEGLPADELFVYEDALRKGRSVVFAFTDDDYTADSARRAMKEEGAESIDNARKQWWIGLRSAEKEHYSKLGRDFEQDEQFYQMGFEAALDARSRGKEYDQVLTEMESRLQELRRQYPDADFEEPFRRGYERGREYYQNLRNKTSA